MHGFLNLNKPKGITSRAVVDAVAQVLGCEKVGHCGTLDPLAAGVLVLAVNAATRLVGYVQELPKTYHAQFRLGATSATDDDEGPIVEQTAASPVAPAVLTAALERFAGAILQVPPQRSAVKVGGVKAYRLARQGESPRLLPRQVVIHRLTLLQYCWPDLELIVECGKGTYIRSLARDLGISLGCGGYVRELTRTAVGVFSIGAALPVDADRQTLSRNVVPISQALRHLFALELSDNLVRQLSHGRAVQLPASQPLEQSELLVRDSAGNILILAKVDANACCLHPVRVLRLT